MREVALICVADPRPTLNLPHGFDLVKDKTVLQVTVFLSRSRRLVHRSVPRDSKGTRERGSVKMVGSGFHELERLECLHQVIPLCGVPCRVSDLKVADAGSSEFASFQARLDGSSNFGSFETRENARVHQVRQRHASS